MKGNYLVHSGRTSTGARARVLLVLAILLAGTWAPSFVQVSEASAQTLPAQQATTPVPGQTTVSQGRIRYFGDTLHFLRGEFLQFWETHGATPVLGLPITEPIVEDGLTVQYLERARLEWHPENPDPNKVELTRLGAVQADSSGLIFDRATPAQAGPNTFYFDQTGHNLSNAFLTYWENNGGLAVFGYPLSEEMVETNPGDGQQYTVQYFERNRFEWHPENPPAFNVQLGLLGVEYAQARGLDPLARIIVPEPVGNGEDLSNSPKLAQLVDPGLLDAVKALGQTPQYRWVPAVLLQYNIPVQFANVGEQGVAGAFETTRSRTRPYLIIIPTSEQGESTAALASVIAHESTHAYDVTGGVISTRISCSVSEEVRAYMNGFGAWLVLQGEDALTRTYPRKSLESAVNNSLIGFNDGSTAISLDFDAQQAYAFIADLYGASCGP